MSEIEMTPERFAEVFQRVRGELGKVVIGQDEVVWHLLTAIFAGGHVLLKGLPGLGRTLIVKTLAEVLGLRYGRIQFTPDLIPTDITGAEVLEHHPETGERFFRFYKGPVFANLVLADEINRSPARTQAALLEVMQERQITVGGQTYFLPKPFIIIATQNSLDTEGVFHLGEAQVDRFLMMIEQQYPTEQEEHEIVRQTTGTVVARVQRVTGPEEVLAMQRFAKEVPVVPSVKEFAMHLVRASRPGEAESTAAAEAKIRLGASPRATQALLLCGKVHALASDRFHVTRHDIVAVAQPVMAHRLLLDFRAVAEGTTYHDVLDELVQRAKEESQLSLSRWIRELLKQPVAVEENNSGG